MRSSANRSRRRYTVVNHDAFDPAKLARAGIGKDGHEVFLNRDYVEADRRIVLGFVEPHFMAGFSGGYKGIFPGSPTSRRSCAITTRA